MAKHAQFKRNKGAVIEQEGIFSPSCLGSEVVSFPVRDARCHFWLTGVNSV